MRTFFYINGLLFKELTRALAAIFSVLSSALSALALAFCIVIVVSIITKGANKKFFVNNKRFIIATLCIVGLSCILSSDINIIKCNVLIIIICLIVILVKSNKSKVTKKINKIVDVEVKKKGEAK